MALSNETPKTSWAFKAHLFIKEVAKAETPLGENDFIFTEDSSKLAAGTYDLGIIAPDGFSIATNDGEKLELRDINGTLLDTLTKEGTMQIAFNILKPSESTRGKFWSTNNETEGHLKVHSLLTAKKYALAFGNVGEDAVDTEAVVFPFASINAKPVYAAGEGWRIECTADVLLGGAALKKEQFFFDFVKLTKALLGIDE